MKNPGTISLILCIAIIVFMFIDKYSNTNTKIIGVVQMEKLVYDFKGMKEATKNYEAKMAKWNYESDSLKNKLKEMYQELKLDSIKKDQVKLRTDIQLFQLYRQSYSEYAQKMQENADKEDKQMTIGVINQINEYIKTFAEKKGYDVILCNQPQMPSIGYSKSQVDITKEVLEYANKLYSGEKD